MNVSITSAYHTMIELLKEKARHLNLSVTPGHRIGAFALTATNGTIVRRGYPETLIGWMES